MAIFLAKFDIKNQHHTAFYQSFELLYQQEFYFKLK